MSNPTPYLYADELAPQPEQGIDLREILGILARRKWTLIQVSLLVLFAGMLGLTMEPPVYQAAAKLLVTTPGRSIILTQVDSNSSLSPLLTSRQARSISTQLEILESSKFREEVRKRVGESVPVSLSFSSDRESEIIRISASSTNPEAAARWANAAANEYISMTESSNREALRATREFVSEIVQRSQAELVSAEKRLLNFHKRTRMPNNEENQALQYADASQLQSRLRDNQARLISLTSRIQSLRARLNREPMVLVEVQQIPNPERPALLAQLADLQGRRVQALTEYRPESAHIRRMDQQITDLQSAVQALPKVLREEVEKLNPRRDTVLAQLREVELERDALESETLQLQEVSGQRLQDLSHYPRWEVELAQIRRDRDLAEKLFVQYNTRLKDLDVRDRGMQANTTLLEKASVPGSPSGTSRESKLLMLALFALVIGAGFAFLHEFLDDRVNDREVLERVVALPVLAEVPMVSDSKDRLLLTHSETSVLMESFRDLRTSIHYASVAKPVRVMGVTSSQVGEGKSVTTANLAISLAAQGKRVVVVDADLRRPSQHRLFGLRLDGGLAEVLAGDLTLTEAFRETPLPNLQVITSGALPPNPPELLGSEPMRKLVQTLREQFDIVLIDTPPVNVVTDMRVIAGEMDGVVLVVEAGRTRKSDLQHARMLVDQTQIRVLGVSLNKVEPGRGSYSYRYSQSRYYYISPTQKRLDEANQPAASQGGTAVADGEEGEIKSLQASSAGAKSETANLPDWE
ncbi:MAG: polysaccharide biosynthesis tyrosine autokinase [Armatimonadota bacterium]